MAFEKHADATVEAVISNNETKLFCQTCGKLKDKDLRCKACEEKRKKKKEEK